VSEAVIAELSERNIGQLIEDWTQAVRADPRIQSDSRLTTPELIDHVPAIVSEICGLMRQGEKPGATNTHEARANVYTRVQQRYTGGDLVRELSFLRIALIDFVVETASQEPLGITMSDRHDAIQLLNLYLDEEMRYAITVCDPGAVALPAGLPEAGPIVVE
jgi:hypothetical protein